MRLLHAGRKLLVLLCVAASAIAPSFATEQPPGKRGISDAGPDASLEYVFDEIEANRLDSALQRTEALLRAYPNFRLAHLIQGDLLLARGRPLPGFGGTPAAQDQVRGLRDEAVARLRAYRERPATTRYIPRYLLQMGPEQRYAVVVDTKRARLYVYENEAGRPRFIADYYVSHGKAGADKKVEGDNRHPARRIRSHVVHRQGEASRSLRAAARFRSITPTNGTSGSAGPGTASGFMARRATPMPARRCRPRGA